MAYFNNFFSLIILMHVVGETETENVVGHVPREISPYFCDALKSGGKMKATVCGRRENKRGNGLEVPYNYLQKGPDKYLGKAECIIKDIVGREKIV